MYLRKLFLCAVYVWEFNEELIVQLPPDLCFLYLLCLDWKVLLCVLKVIVFFFFLEKCLINQACFLFSSFAYFRLAVFLLSPMSLKSWASFWVKLSGLNHYRIIPYKFEDYNFFRLMKLRTGISKRYSKINTIYFTYVPWA